jgi:hypothetical protein
VSIEEEEKKRTVDLPVSIEEEEKKVEEEKDH